jgi:hypothetical protein
MKRRSYLHNGQCVGEEGGPVLALRLVQQLPQQSGLAVLAAQRLVMRDVTEAHMAIISTPTHQ